MSDRVAQTDATWTAVAHALVAAMQRPRSPVAASKAPGLSAASANPSVAVAIINTARIVSCRRASPETGRIAVGCMLRMGG